MKTAAYILCLIATIVSGVLLFPLLWTIPMTKKIYHAKETNTKLTIGFDVCVLLFLNMIAGILLLVDDSEN